MQIKISLGLYLLIILKEINNKHRNIICIISFIYSHNSLIKIFYFCVLKRVRRELLLIIFLKHLFLRFILIKSKYQDLMKDQSWIYFKNKKMGEL
jgi:hypothetical protein